MYFLLLDIEEESLRCLFYIRHIPRCIFYKLWIKLRNLSIPVKYYYHIALSITWICMYDLKDRLSTNIVRNVFLKSTYKRWYSLFMYEWLFILIHLYMSAACICILNIKQKKMTIALLALNALMIILHFWFYCYTPMSLCRFFDNKVVPFMKLYIDLAVSL